MSKWDSENNDPGRLDDKYQAADAIIERINILDKLEHIEHAGIPTSVKGALLAGGWFNSWTKTAKSLVGHCQQTYFYRTARVEYFDSPEEIAKANRVKDSAALETETLALEYIIARYNFDRAPQSDLTTDERKVLDQIKSEIAAIDSDIRHVCAEQLGVKGIEHFLRMVMDEHRHDMGRGRS